MCVKLFPEHLIPSPHPPHSTNIYIYEVTIMLKMRVGENDLKWSRIFFPLTPIERKEKQN